MWIFALFDADASGELARRSRGRLRRRARRRGRRTAPAGHCDASPREAGRARRGSGAARGRCPGHGARSRTLRRRASASERSGAGSSSSSALGIGSPCGSCVGKPSDASITRLELLRERVLEPVCLGVHGVERRAEPRREVLLEQPVVADHLDRDALAPSASGARRGTARARRARAGRASSASRSPRRARRPSARRAREVERAPAGLELVELLHVVLDGRGEACGLAQGLSNIQFRRDKIQPEAACSGPPSPSSRPARWPGSRSPRPSAQRPTRATTTRTRPRATRR